MLKTLYEKVNSEAPEERIILKAAQLLQAGGLVAFPTETVYGLGGNGLDPQVCKKIYVAKGRPSDNPLILHISQLNELSDIVAEIPPLAKKVMDAFWPGPLTLIFPKADKVPLEATGGLSTVAVRFPSHKVARAIIRCAGLPIAAPSANSSGKPSPTRASHVQFDLDGKIDMIVDGGATQVGLESTILDVTGQKAMLLRPGGITKEMLETVLGPIEVDPAVLDRPLAGVAPKAPGMKYTHYSPKADVILVMGELSTVAQTVNRLAKADEIAGKKVGVLATEQTKEFYAAGTILSLGDREKIETIGANLFKMLRKLDYMGMDVVYSEVFDESGEGMAIMNRLKKASGYHIIEV